MDGDANDVDERNADADEDVVLAEQSTNIVALGLHSSWTILSRHALALEALNAQHAELHELKRVLAALQGKSY